MINKKIIYGGLKLICYIAFVLIAAFRFALIVSKNKDREMRKYKMYYGMLIFWLDILEDGKSICGYLKKRGFDDVAVYGGRDLGWHVVRQLCGTDVVVKYVIDKTVFSGKVGSLPIYRPDDNLPEVDAVIVTPVWDYDSIKEQMSKQVQCPVISLMDVIERAKDE